MSFFDSIPNRLFTVLTSSKKVLYLDALFVVRDAFRNTELIIRREDLIGMLTDQLEDHFNSADFSEEAEEDGMADENTIGLSGKVHILLRHLVNTGWIEEEDDSQFNRNITVPNYAIQIINLLYDLSHAEIREYNSYVYATYASLKNAGDNPDYLFQALNSAHKNTENLVEELKILFNNIKHYETQALRELEINNLLREYFDEYKEGVFDTIYFPLKTIDSVPRFKGTIITILNDWYANEAVTEQIVRQGMKRKIFSSLEEGTEQTQKMINDIISTYETIEDMIELIDQKHSDYTRVSGEKIRYMLNNDMSIKGKLIDLLKRSDDEEVMERMQNCLEVHQYQYADQYSMSTRMKRTGKSEGAVLVIDKQKDRKDAASFLKELRSQYSSRSIDSYMHRKFCGSSQIATESISINSAEDFKFLLLGTIRAQERSADYTIEFEDGYCNNNGCLLPKAVFRRKEHVQ